MTNHPRFLMPFAYCFSVLIALGTCEHTARAADLSSPPSKQLVAPAPKQWEFRFTPYAWATSVKGDATIAGQTVDVDANFLDVIEDSESILGLFRSP
jgi:hypothetical protein